MRQTRYLVCLAMAISVVLLSGIEVQAEPVYPNGKMEYILYYHSGGGPRRWSTEKAVFYNRTPDPTPTTVGEDLTREVFAESSVALSTSFDTMVTKVGISNEVALGASITHTWYWSISPTVPGYHKLVVEWGSEGGSGYGKEVYFLE